MLVPPPTPTPPHPHTPQLYATDSSFSDTINDIPYLHGTKINNLLFANDSETFSLPKEDLSVLEICSKKWIRVKSKQHKNNYF